MKTAILPGDSTESLFVATQLGEIYIIRNGVINTFLDIRSRVIKLNRYDERGLLGLAFHPEFNFNGLFYLHYSLAGTQGPGALSGSFLPDPCDESTLNLKWTNREVRFDHVDTVEEWILTNGQVQKRRTLLNLRRPFLNHNGVNSLNFSPETGNLILTTGDGGSGYDPFNLSQDDMEIAGKIIEINLSKFTFMLNPPLVTRFIELPVHIQEALSVMAKGVRNIPGISFQRNYNQFIKYVGNVGQDLVEAIYSFGYYRPIPVTELIQAPTNTHEGLVNLGWRGWEGDMPTCIIKDCSMNKNLIEKTIAYFNDAVKTSIVRQQPLISYYHKDFRPDKFSGTALTGVQFYIGNRIPDLTGNIIFTDIARKEETQSKAKGVLAYTKAKTDCMLNDFSIIDIEYNFTEQSPYFVSLGTNRSQTSLFLGTNGSMNVGDFNQGTVYEII